MIALDHAEYAAGIMSLVVIAVVAGSGALATFSIWRSIAPQWRRIARLAAGHVEDHPLPAASVAPLPRDGTPSSAASRPPPSQPFRCAHERDRGAHRARGPHARARRSIR